MDNHFWEALCTILFLVIFFRPIKNFVIGGIDKYKNKIEKEVSSVEDLKKNAEENLKHYRDLHKEFMEKSNLVIETSKENLARISEDAKKRLEHQIAAHKGLHQERIRLYQQETLHELRKKALVKAFRISQNYLSEKYTNITNHQIEETLSLVKQNKNLYN